jgi:hypothetical protein
MESIIKEICQEHHLSASYLAGLLDSLGDCDGRFVALLIRDGALRATLERHAIARTNIRGSSYPTERWREALEATLALLG